MNELQQRKAQLRSLENRFKSVIESDSDSIEGNLKKFLKIGAIVGGSLFVAYRTYRLLCPKEKSGKKSKESKKSFVSGIGYSAKQRLFAAAATLLYKEFQEHFRKGQKMIAETVSTQSKESTSDPSKDLN